MGAVLLLPNPFDPSVRTLYRTKRRMTVRRFVSRNKKLPTSVRVVKGRKVRDFVQPTVCTVNGKAVMRSEWSRTVIGDADVVLFQTLPAGGVGGGGGGSSPLGIVLAIAIAVAAPYIGTLLGPALAGAIGVSSALGTSIVTGVAGIALAGVAAGIMSLFTPPPPAATNSDSGYGGTAQSSPTYDITAQGNTARLQQPIPVLMGLSRVFPDYVMPPYVRYDSNDEYLYVLLAVTQGECDISAVQIGDTPVSSFASITWAKVEPGASTTLVDTRFLPCTDLTDTVLPDAAAGSPWQGPFAANPPGTLVNKFEIDLVAPKGLYAFDSSGGFNSRSVTVVVQAEQIDDTGLPVTGASWATIDTITMTGATNTPQRQTYSYDFGSAGRWQIRLQRTDTMDTSATSGHQIDWTGLRGRLLSARVYANVTLLEAKMKATGDLDNQTSRQLNVIATGKKPTWDPTLNGGAGGMTTTTTITRSICDAIADVVRNPVYGARQPDSVIDLAGIYAQKATLDGLGYTFDFVFDQSGTAWDALTKIALTAVGVPVIQGNKVRLVRDVASTAPVMMFTPRNIRQGSLALEYKMVDEETADSIIATYMDPNSWAPDTVTEAFDDSPQDNPATMNLDGITYRPQARDVVWNLLRANRYRRRVIGWGTEMEGLLLLYGDPSSFSYDIPQWGQSAEIVAWDDATRTATVSEDMVFTAGATHYVLLRAKDGTASGPFAVTGGTAANELVIGSGTLPDILTDGDAERTYIQFGPGSAYSKRVKIIQVTPRDALTADIQAVDDDLRMYDPTPAETNVAPGASTDPITIHISAAASKVNLRALADDNGFTGLLVQQVTIVQDIGAPITSDDPAVPAIQRGSWPSGYMPIVVLKDVVTGADGTPGTGGAINGGAGGAGGAGGTALDTSTGPLSLDDSAATLRGGKGAGGGGGGGGFTAYSFDDGEGDSGVSSLNGGKGGAGNGGLGLGGDGSGPASAGAGGNGGAQGAGYGIAGGTGVAGGTGSTPDGTGLSGGGAGGAGGAGGKAINGIANITRVGTTGTETGAVV